MWNVNGNNLQMCEGDFGLKLPIKITGVTFTASDEAKLTIKSAVNGDVILTKTFTDITQNTVQFEITENETALLKAGSYVYRLDWYQDGAFFCNLIPTALFKVVDAA